MGPPNPNKLPHPRAAPTRGTRTSSIGPPCHCTPTRARRQPQHTAFVSGVWAAVRQGAVLVLSCGCCVVAGRVLIVILGMDVVLGACFTATHTCLISEAQCVWTWGTFSLPPDSHAEGCKWGGGGSGSGSDLGLGLGCQPVMVGWAVCSESLEEDFILEYRLAVNPWM